MLPRSVPLTAWAWAVPLHVKAIAAAAPTARTTRVKRPLIYPSSLSNVVEGRRLTVRPDQRVGMSGVVDDLVLVRNRTAPIFGHEVLHAAVRALDHLPLELQVEVVEGVDGDDIAATIAIAAFGKLLQPS